jgi:hypothetical protein
MNLDLGQVLTVVDQETSNDGDVGDGTLGRGALAEKYGITGSDVSAFNWRVRFCGLGSGVIRRQLCPALLCSGDKTVRGARKLQRQPSPWTTPHRLAQTP